MGTNAPQPAIQTIQIPPTGNQEGYFGFLDALGIRGRWQAEEPERIIRRYESWYDGVVAIDSATGLSTLDVVPEHAIPGMTGAVPPGFRTELWAFSDSIAFALNTRGDANEVLTQRLANALGQIFVTALQSGFLLRGAVAFGRYYTGRDGRILIGPAVDEAAAWHDQADWAGVVLTPSAGRTVIPASVPGIRCRFGSSFMDYDVPLKGGSTTRLWALNWPQFNRSDILAMVDRHFVRPPVTPEVQRKRANTLDFFESSRAHEEEIRVARSKA